LHLHHLSGGGYDALRKSGGITLPSQWTLRKYTNFADECTTFSNEVNEQQIASGEVGSWQEWKKKVILLLDKMYIRE
jgi:hypothetical protein